VFDSQHKSRRYCEDELGPTLHVRLDAVAGKGFEPEVMLRTLQSLLTGVPYDELPEGELVAMEGEDAPGSCSCGRNFAWVHTEEFWGDATEVLPFLGEVTALARRAQQAGERLYCWMCL